MPRPFTTLSLALSLAAVACQSKDPAVLELDGESVRRSDFDRHVAALEARGFGPLPPEARRGLLETFLEQRALVIEARRRGLLGAGAPAEQETEAVARLLASAVPSPRVSEQEIAAWHASHAAELAAPERVTLRQILVGSSNEARDVKRRLAKDPRAFDSLARTISKGPEAALGGYMGSFERGQLPARARSRGLRAPRRGHQRARALAARVSCTQGRVPAGSPRDPTRRGTREDPRPPRAREARGGRAGVRDGSDGSGQGEI